MLDVVAAVVEGRARSVFVTSSRKRTQREHRMQRSWSSITCGPSGIAFPLWTFPDSGTRLSLPVVVHVVVLQLALARLVADRAVDRVVDEQELEHGLLRGDGLRARCVCTTMPSVTRVLQAICSFGDFSISTRHMRQLPAIESPGCQQ